MRRIFGRRHIIAALAVFSLLQVGWIGSPSVAAEEGQSLVDDILGMLEALSADSETPASPFEPPGQGGTPPGQGGAFPSPIQPPGQGGTPPGQGGELPQPPSPDGGLPSDQQE